MGAFPTPANEVLMRESARRRAPTTPGISKGEKLRLIVMAVGFVVVLVVFILLWF